MKRATPERDRTRKRWFRSFRRSESGAVAIEFGIVSIPFFLLLFAIIEVAMYFFIGQMLDNATGKASRLIRTGQAQSTSMDANGFKTAICDQIAVLSSCSSDLTVDVQVYSSFGAGSAPTDPVDDKTGQMKPTVFNAGGSGDIIVVRAYYKWPVFFNVIPPSGTALADGSRLIGSIFAFRNEPF